VRPITLGVVDGERVAVKSGVAVGELVVTEGGDRLRDGAQVLLPQAAGAGPASAVKTPGTHGGRPKDPHRPRTQTSTPQ